MKNKAIDNKPSMERISEVEEDKYNTIIDKYNDGINKDEFNIDDKNFDEFMNKNINSSNLKEYFDPNNPLVPKMKFPPYKQFPGRKR